jgi:transposase
MSIVYFKNKNNGVTYVYDSIGHWDKQKQQSRNVRKCIGKLSPITGEFIPSKKSAYESLPETAYPKAETSKRSFYGATYLFDAIGKRLGIADDLKRCFPESYKQILSIAYYLIMEDRNPMSRFTKWASTHAHPFNKDISSQRSSDIFGSIREDAKNKFFLLQSQRRLEEEFLVYDTTSISSYSKLLKQVKYGMNKDHDPLPQINLALLFGNESRLPVYCRKLSGNIADVKTIRNMLSDIDFLKLDKVKLVMDRGFYSEENINALYERHYKFLIAAKTSLRFVREKIDQVRGTMASRSHYSSKYCLYFDSFLTNWDYSEIKRGGTIKGARRIYLHLFYNDQKATDDKIEFNNLLDSLENEILSDKRNPEHEKLYAKYYEIKETPIRGVSLTVDQKAVEFTEKNYGYFALISNCLKNPLEALEIYRSKDMIEKAFGNLKERLNMRRTSVSSEENLEGKLFIQFVALIYLSYIKKAMSDNDLFKNYTMQELLDEFDIIECFEQEGYKRRIGEITKKQINLYELLGFNAPA